MRANHHADSIGERTMRALLDAVALDPKRGFVSFMGGSLGIEPVRLERLAHGAPNDGAQDAMAMAKLANTIPSVTGMWSHEAPTFESHYRAWLERAVLPESSLSHEENAILLDALQTVALHGVGYRCAERRVHDLTQELQEAHGNHEFKRILELKLAVANAAQDWQARGGKARYETARANMTQSMRRGQSVIRDQLRVLYERALAGSAASDLQGHLPVVPLLPAPLDRMTWKRCTLRAEPRGARHGGDARPSVALPAWPELWTREYADPLRALDLDTSHWQLSFDWLRLGLDRSAWFDPTLLQSRDWWWPGASRDWPLAGGPLFSDGAPPPATRGVWPLIATELLLVRDVVVDLPEEEHLSQLLAHTRHADEAGIGPLTVRSAHPTQLCAAFSPECESPSRLRVPQLQIAAVLCDVLRAAPNPDPAWLTRGGAVGS